jgi:hypothetical protein
VDGGVLPAVSFEACCCGGETGSPGDFCCGDVPCFRGDLVPPSLLTLRGSLRMIKVGAFFLRSGEPPAMYLLSGDSGSYLLSGEFPSEREERPSAKTAALLPAPPLPPLGILSSEVTLGS